MNLLGLLGAAGRGQGRGLRTVGQQIGQRLFGAADDDELLRQSLPPSYDGSPNPASDAPSSPRYQAPQAPQATEAITPTVSPYDRLPPGGSNPRPLNPYSINKEHDFRPVLDPAIAEMRFAVSPYSQTTPVDPVSAKLYAKDAAQPFNPDPDPYEAAHKASVSGRYMDAKQGGKWKGVLRNAALGALQGIQSASRNPYNDWRAMLAGAAGGAGTAGVLTAVNDEMGAELGWEMLDRPRYGQEQERKYDEYKRQAEKAKTLSDIQYNHARTEAEDRRNIYHNTPNETIDVRTGLPVPGTAKSPIVTPHYEMLKGSDGNPYYRNVADPVNQGMPAYIKDAQTRPEVRTVDGAIIERDPQGNWRETYRSPKANDYTAQDDRNFRDQAKALARQAFAPDEAARIQSEYEDQAYRAQVTPADEEAARRYDRVAQEKIEQARVTARQRARGTYDSEMQRWEQLFYDELRQGGRPTRTGEEVTPNQVEAVAKAKNIKLEDTKRLLRVLGYRVP